MLLTYESAVQPRTKLLLFELRVFYFTRDYRLILDAFWKIHRALRRPTWLASKEVSLLFYDEGERSLFASSRPSLRNFSIK